MSSSEQIVASNHASSARLMNVIIVDDAEINVTLLKHMVARLPDCIAQCFMVPEQGLAWCSTQMPDLVIVDFMMPGLDGINFIRKLRLMPGRENIPVLMITANDEITVRYDALEAGANDFLSKPIDRTEFLSRSRNMLALRQAQKQLEYRAGWLASEVEKATCEIVEREREIILRLSRAAEYRDPETGQHIL
jgi:putative two-component system response regulator